MKKFWKWVSQAPKNLTTPETQENQEPSQISDRTLYLNGQIAEASWFDDDITPQLFKDELMSGDGNITVWINSPGGDCVAAAQIYNMLKEYSGDVTIKIDGLAASAASVIAMAGDKVVMSPVAMMMIHNPSTVAFGDRVDMQKSMAMLDEVKESIINAYEIKTGMSRTKLAHMMDAETWINGNDAIIQGFATQTFESEVKAEVSSAVNAIRQVDNLLAKSGLPRNEQRELLNQIKGSTQDAASKGTQDAALSDLAFQAELLSLNLQLSSM